MADYRIISSDNHGFRAGGTCGPTEFPPSTRTWLHESSAWEMKTETYGLWGSNAS